MSDVLIYGATGYMGKLCTREFLRAGIRPILAGRDAAVGALAAAAGLNSAVFDLNAQSISQHLSGVSLVINLAGPFCATQKPLLEACLATGVHYIDIAGEVDEMRGAFAFDAAARDAKIMIMPGAGFGVVPTDIAAHVAKSQLPGATLLTICYATEGGVSRGTLKTVLKDINRAGVRRVGSALIAAAPAETKIDLLSQGKRFMRSITRGELTCLRRNFDKRR